MIDIKLESKHSPIKFFQKNMVILYTIVWFQMYLILHSNKTMV